MKPARVVFCLTALILTAALSADSGDARRERSPVFKVGVETVFLKVSVVDRKNRFVAGLSKEDFLVFEDKIQQEISAFVQEPSPVSIGIILDVSGSMKSNNNMRGAQAALAEVLSNTYPGDEFFLIAFNSESVLVKDFTDDAQSILGESLMRPSGQTAVWDAVYQGLNKIKEARNEKSALILITDGEDNSSRYSVADVREYARESDDQIYVVGETGPLGYGRAEIGELARLTGGRAFFPDSLNDLEYYIDLVHDELRSQYVLGYVPSRKDREGKWRKVKVKLDQPKGSAKLVVRAREGYYSSGD